MKYFLSIGIIIFISGCSFEPYYGPRGLVTPERAENNLIALAIIIGIGLISSIFKK